MIECWVDSIPNVFVPSERGSRVRRQRHGGYWRWREPQRSPNHGGTRRSLCTSHADSGTACDEDPESPMTARSGVHCSISKPSCLPDAAANPTLLGGMEQPRLSDHGRRWRCGWSPHKALRLFLFLLLFLVVTFCLPSSWGLCVRCRRCY